MDSGTCYLCGRPGADTKEHVFPRCLYPGKLPADVVTLPAHAACNRFTSKDEELFRNHLSAAIPPDNPAHPLWPKTWKAIHRPEAAGMQRLFYSEMISLPVLDADGEVRREPMVAQLLNERADRVIAKIVKGLFTWKTGELLPSEAVLWRFGQAELGRDRIRLPEKFRLHELFDVSWGRAVDEPRGTMWFLGFYRVAWFWATTMPRDRPTAGAERDGVPMEWPGPNH